jgi:hypothetical protein
MYSAVLANELGNVACLARWVVIADADWLRRVI